MVVMASARVVNIAVSLNERDTKRKQAKGHEDLIFSFRQWNRKVDILEAHYLAQPYSDGS